MKTAAVLLLSLTLGGCGSVKWKKWGPPAPGTPAEQAAAEENRREAAARCAATGGEISQRSDRNGSSRADYRCERPD